MTPWLLRVCLRVCVRVVLRGPGGDAKPPLRGGAGTRAHMHAPSTAAAFLATWCPHCVVTPDAWDHVSRGHVGYFLMQSLALISAGAHSVSSGRTCRRSPRGPTCHSPDVCPRERPALDGLPRGERPLAACPLCEVGC